jgi:DNA-binding MarR family transcriptional regulator
MVGTTDPQTAGSIVLLTRLAREILTRCSAGVAGMNFAEEATLAYLHDHPRAPQRLVSTDLLMAPNTVVVVLNHLENLGYVERQRDPDDRRRHIVAITEAGNDAQERAELALSKIENELLSKLSGAELAMFRKLLVKALESIRPTTSGSVAAVATSPACQ